MKKWRGFILGECVDCGSGVEVLTNAKKGHIAEGDEVRCNNRCGATGKIVVEIDHNWIWWDEKSEGCNK